MGYLPLGRQYRRGASTKNNVQEDTSLTAPEGELWVNKYAPRSFMDLLSDEPTNREVLKWLKAWDACVFRGAPPPPNPEQRILLLSGPPGVLSVLH